MLTPQEVAVQEITVNCDTITGRIDYTMRHIFLSCPSGGIIAVPFNAINEVLAIMQTAIGYVRPRDMPPVSDADNEDGWEE